MAAVEAVVVALITLAFVVSRPRGLNEGLAGLLGALLVILLRLVPLREALRLEAAAWNVFLFFLGMMAIVALADQSGVFDLVAFSAARLAGGRVALLYAAVFLVGSVIIGIVATPILLLGAILGLWLTSSGYG